MQGHHIQANSTYFFRNGGRPSGVIEVPGSITEENAKKLKGNWDSGYTGENAEDGHTEQRGKIQPHDVFTGGCADGGTTENDG